MNRFSFHLLMLFCTVSLAHLQSYGQETDYIRIFRPVPLSPRAAELTRHISHPTGEFSGVPTIEFPLFEIKVGELVVPFTLAYHAGGIKVSQKETEVGLGWSIKGAGIITRAIGSVQDEKPVQGSFSTPLYELHHLLGKKNTTDPTLRRTKIFMKCAR